MMRFRLRMLMLVATCWIGGCGHGSDEKHFDNLTVAATVYPLADVARQVGGEYVNVFWVVENGQSLAGVQPSSDLRSKLSNADFVVSGGISEPWATSGFSDPLQRQRIIRLDLLEPA